MDHFDDDITDEEFDAALIRSAERRVEQRKARAAMMDDVKRDAITAQWVQEQERMT